MRPKVEGKLLRIHRARQSATDPITISSAWTTAAIWRDLMAPVQRGICDRSVDQKISENYRIEERDAKH
jgi:hypothetical protein